MIDLICFRGKLLLCVIPPPEPEALKSVRWHPKQPDTVAVASESRIYLLSITEAARRFGNDAVAQSDLTQVGPVITLSSVSLLSANDSTIYNQTLSLWLHSHSMFLILPSLLSQKIPHCSCGEFQASFLSGPRKSLGKLFLPLSISWMVVSSSVGRVERSSSSCLS